MNSSLSHLLDVLSHFLHWLSKSAKLDLLSFSAKCFLKSDIWSTCISSLTLFHRFWRYLVAIANPPFRLQSKYWMACCRLLHSQASTLRPQALQKWLSNHHSHRQSQLRYSQKLQDPWYVQFVVLWEGNVGDIFVLLFLLFCLATLIIYFRKAS